METIILYSLKVSMSVALFYGLYMLLLRKDTFLRMQRVYFLLVVLFSLMFPFISFSGSVLHDEDLSVPAYMFSEIEVFVNQHTRMSDSAFSSSFLFPLLLAIIFIGIIFLIFRFIIVTVKLCLQLKKMKPMVDNLIVVEGENIASFSFFRWIVINVEGRNANQIDDIITHESAHASQLHSIDVILYELFCILFWWNPFVWLMKNEMKLNLEYLADDAVLKNKRDLKEYQYTLLQISVANSGVAIINNFNISHLKKRITMMNKKRTPLLSATKYLLIFPLAFGLLQCNFDKKKKDPVSETVAVDLKSIPAPVVEETDDDIEKDTFTIVQVMPSFPGGEMAMMKFISDNLKYPLVAQNDGVQGRVVVRFVVKADGVVKEVEVLRGISPECDAEAVRVIKSMPNWTPGMQDNKPVSVYFTLPILFRLK